jgi:hypothetical protein
MPAGIANPQDITTTNLYAARNRTQTFPLKYQCG